MVNKYQVLRQGVKLFPACLICFSINYFCSAQNISDYYVSQYKESSTLYFIDKQNGWNNKNFKSTFEYDITYDSAMDSLVVNFTLLSDVSIKINKIRIANMAQSIEGEAGKIFIGNNKNKYHYRYTVKFPFKDFKQIFSNKEFNPSFVILTHDNRMIEMNIGHRKWEKQQYIVSKILEIISMNKTSP